MPIIGPDGKPLSANGPHIRGPLIGGPKALSDLGAFKDADVDAFIAGAESIIAKGQPLEIPAMLPTGDICRLAYTLKVRGDRIKTLEAELEQARGTTPERPVLNLFSAPE